MTATHRTSSAAKEPTWLHAQTKEDALVEPLVDQFMRDERRYYKRLGQEMFDLHVALAAANEALDPFESLPPAYAELLAAASNLNLLAAELPDHAYVDLFRGYQSAALAYLRWPSGTQVG